MSARLLETISVEKPWGRDQLRAPFRSVENQRIGEVWFEPPDEWPDVLIKYLFTSEKLSVQVHPDDASAPPGHRGKEECWLVLDAEPGAQLAAGFTRDVGPEELRASATSGTVEDLLQWHQVRRGDFFFLPARTVHAIGAGLTILEVQQNSDITYRLYDYGRRRELHLDEAVSVADAGPYPAGNRRHFDLDRPADVVASSYFEMALAASDDCLDESRDRLILPLSGSVTVADACADAGACLFAPAGEPTRFKPESIAVVVTRP